MKKVLGLVLLSAFVILLAQTALAAPTWDKNPEDFMHGIALDIEGETWYFNGPGSVMGAKDIPGHTWVQTEDPYQVVGRHYNVGPPMVPPGTPWWATGEPYGVMLFKVHGIIAPWSMEIAERMAARGYVHDHELVDGSGNEHPYLVVWLKHTAVRSFSFNGGPHPEFAHDVKPGVDYDFLNNWFMPYSP